MAPGEKQNRTLRRTLTTMELTASEGETLHDVHIDGPEHVVGDDGDVARIEANLRLSPSQRLARATRAANFVLTARRAMTAARNGQP